MRNGAVLQLLVRLSGLLFAGREVVLGEVVLGEVLQTFHPDLLLLVVEGWDSWLVEGVSFHHVGLQLTVPVVTDVHFHHH